MAYRLRDNLHYCICNGRAVFLDVDADRYFCLPGSVDAAFQSIAEGAPALLPPTRALQPLLSRGLLLPDRANISALQTVCIPTPTHDLGLSNDRRPRWGLAALAVLSQLRWAALLRHRSLAEIKSAIERKAATTAISSPEDANFRIARLATAFAIADRILPPADRCLVRSLAFHALCHRVGASSTLVIGVRTNPFTAHCWVQRGGCVLTGDYEQARLFTAVLAI